MIGLFFLIVLSLELTYNGARDLYASMEQQIQPLNLKSNLSLLPSLDNPAYYKKLKFYRTPNMQCIAGQLQ